MTFLQRPNLPTLTLEGIENLNSCMYIKEIEFVIKNLPTKNIPGPDDFIIQFHQISRNKIMPVLHKLL